MCSASFDSLLCLMALRCYYLFARIEIGHWRLRLYLGPRICSYEAIFKNFIGELPLIATPYLNYCRLLGNLVWKIAIFYFICAASRQQLLQDFYFAAEYCPGFIFPHIALCALAYLSFGEPRRSVWHCLDANSQSSLALAPDRPSRTYSAYSISFLLELHTLICQPSETFLMDDLRKYAFYLRQLRGLRIPWHASPSFETAPGLGQFVFALILLTWCCHWN